MVGQPPCRELAAALDGPYIVAAAAHCGCGSSAGHQVKRGILATGDCGQGTVQKKFLPRAVAKMLTSFFGGKPQIKKTIATWGWGVVLQVSLIK